MTGTTKTLMDAAKIVIKNVTGNVSFLAEIVSERIAETGLSRDLKTAMTGTMRIMTRVLTTAHLNLQIN